LTNNDILRRLRYTFNFNDKKMVSLFALADLVVTREQISQWLKKDDDTDYVNCSDIQLATFLNGFINEKRGKKEGPKPQPEKRLTNNIILTKLKIALNLKAEEVILLLDNVDFRIGKPELSAFFRKPAHKHYRECKDQVLRNFLQGIDKKYHVARTTKFKEKSITKEEVISNQEDALGKRTYQGARPMSGKVYNNPNKKASSNASRTVLKLDPKKIWEQSPK